MFANDQIADLVDAGALTKLGGDVAEYVKSSNPEAMAATVTYNGDILFGSNLTKAPRMPRLIRHFLFFLSLVIKATFALDSDRKPITMAHL